MTQVSVLFVCTGNICRSPTAEGVFRNRVMEAGLAGRVVIDSAGTHDYHAGEPPDPRAVAAAARRGYDLSAQRARRVRPQDFHDFDYLLAMDRDNLGYLRALKPAGSRAHLALFLDFAPALAVAEVPDPYYGGSRAFEQVLDLAERAADGLLEHLMREHLAAAPKRLPDR